MNKNHLLQIGLFLSIFFTNTVHALVGTGGYSPFGFSTQKKADGGRDTFSFNPMLTFNGVFPLFGQHLFAPLVGYVFHSNEFDETKKNTIFILADVAYVVNSQFLLRYGIGSFLTKVGGKGGNILLQNGNSTTAFAKPDHTATSYNTTLNFGLEHEINRNYALQIESYIFSVLNKNAREVSYSIGVNYYTP